MTGYSPSEMMIVASARALAGARTVLVGVGLPNIACNLARRTTAPDLELIYESGVFGAAPARLPLSIGDPTLVSQSRMVSSMADLFMFYLQGARVEVALLGTAQIDRYGNMNTTVIGDYHTPAVRLPGSGGACDIATHAGRVVAITRLDSRTFVERLDFQTTPGHLHGSHAREAIGLPGAGPESVVTDRAVFAFDLKSKEMTLAELFPGTTLDAVETRVGWPLRRAPRLVEVAPPTEEELSILRRELDPEGLYR